MRADCARTGAPLAAALALACLAEIPEALAACERLGYVGKIRTSKAEAPVAPKQSHLARPSRK